MPALAPVTHHLDLYAYWRATRGHRMMPARGDLNPGDIPTLLPHLILVDKVDDTVMISACVQRAFPGGA